MRTPSSRPSSVERSQEVYEVEKHPLDLGKELADFRGRVERGIGDKTERKEAEVILEHLPPVAEKTAVKKEQPRAAAPLQHPGEDLETIADGLADRAVIGDANTLRAAFARYEQSLA